MSRFGKLCTERQAHPSHKLRHMHAAAHESLQDVTSFMSNIKISFILNILHFVKDTAVRFQSLKLCSRKQNVIAA